MFQFLLVENASPRINVRRSRKVQLDPSRKGKPTINELLKNELFMKKTFYLFR